MKLKTNSQNLTNSFLKLVIANLLKKQKTVIGGLSDEAELMAYFEEQKGKVLDLEKKVERVDNSIENEVKILYKID